MLLGINCKLDGMAVRGGESSPNFLAGVWLWDLSCKRWHIFFVCWACGWIWIVRLGRDLRWETNVHCMVHVSICWPAGTKTWGTCQLQTAVWGALSQTSCSHQLLSFLPHHLLPPCATLAVAKWETSVCFWSWWGFSFLLWHSMKYSVAVMVGNVPFVITTSTKQCGQA